MNPLDRFMSLLGYVPRPAKYAESLFSLKIDIDSASVDTVLAKLNKLTKAAHRAKAVASSIPAPAPLQFAAAELVADAARDELVCELRALVQEIRQDRQMSHRHPYTGSGGTGPAELNDSIDPG